MMYIKLDEDMNLTITVNEPIYRGDNLKGKIIYLIPKVIGGIDTQSACVYLNYIRADGTADIALLEKDGTEYNTGYYKYMFPITCKISKYAGEVCTWIQIYSGKFFVAKSSECVLNITESKDMDNYLSDKQITALYQMQKKLAEATANPASDWTSIDVPDINGFVWEPM